MQVDHPKEKCRNPDCHCDVEAGRAYCSEHCRNASGYAEGEADDKRESGGCRCGHGDCAAA